MLEEFSLELKKICPQAKIASLVGRTFAMERDNHWERTQIAFDMLANQKGKIIENPIAYIHQEYLEGKLDYLIDPAIVTENGQPVGPLQENDVLIFCISFVFFGGKGKS